MCRQTSGCGMWVISFVKITQIRWASRSRSRSKERRAWRKDNQEAHGQDGVEQTLQGESRLRRDSTTDYAADNSSEHSSTATPLTQSPRHRLLNIQHGNDGLSFTWCTLYVCANVKCRCWRLWIRLRSGLVSVNLRSDAVTQRCYTERWRLSIALCTRVMALI
jgi:hypothetical protein